MPTSWMSETSGPKHREVIGLETKRRAKSLTTRAVLPTVLLTLFACLLAGCSVLLACSLGSVTSLHWMGLNTVRVLAEDVGRQSSGAIEEKARALGCSRLSLIKVVRERPVLAYDSLEAELSQPAQGARVEELLFRLAGANTVRGSSTAITSQDAVILERTAEGWLLTAATPVGSSAWLVAEIDATQAVNDGLEQAVGLAAGTSCFLALLALMLYTLLRWGVIKPVQAMERACAQMDCGSLHEVEKQCVGEVASLAAYLHTALEDMENRVVRERDRAALEAKEETELRLAREINASVLPLGLPQMPGQVYFDLSGKVERGSELGSQFYDHFFIDPGLLCVVIGAVPGGGTPEALFMVVAQTAIRSRLRQGLSLAETMADVNRQLYDLGKSFSLEALVATLNVANGWVSYVNAGAPLPLIMLNEDRYEWLSAPVYTPLGKNENVSYRVEEFRLKQGDRLFFHTPGIDQITNWEGKFFGDERLRVSLNLSRARNLDLGGLLSFLGDEAAAWSEQNRIREGFALLVLEYSKGEKALAHCDVPAVPKSAAVVSAFLKRQFEENHITMRHYARVAVLVDEMFILCCRWSVHKETVMVECGLAPDSQMVNIRITAVLGGVDPLGIKEGTTQNAVDFIRHHTDYISFHAGEARDTITMVCFLS